ncbi:MAG: serine hydrolase domain-containing protein [Sporolactobacillus sp.]
MNKHRKQAVAFPVLLIVFLLAALLFTGLLLFQHRSALGIRWQSSAKLSKDVHLPVHHPHAKILGTAQQAQPASHMATGTLQQEGQKIDGILNATGFSGTAVVVSNDKILLDKGYQFSDRATNEPNTPTTQYYIGSMTKALTAAAFMQLRQRGLIDFSTPVSQYYPSFPNGKAITLLTLLDHVSGLGSDHEALQNLTPDQMVAKIAALNPHLHSRPGTSWSYEDTNYALIGAILEKVCQNTYHESLHDYMRANIFEKAGMHDTDFGTVNTRHDNLSYGYARERIDKPVIRQQYLPSFTQLIGCGDIYTTAWDLYLFDEALSRDKLTTDQSRNDLFTERFAGTQYMLGWYRNRGGWGADTYASHGVLSGWMGSNSFSIDRSSYVILLSNVYDKTVDIPSLNERIFAILANKSQK